VLVNISVTAQLATEIQWEVRNFFSKAGDVSHEVFRKDVNFQTLTNAYVVSGEDQQQAFNFMTKLKALSKSGILSAKAIKSLTQIWFVQCSFNL